MKTNGSVGPLINYNGDVIRDCPCVASMLSKYFEYAFSAEDTNDHSLVDTSNVLSHTDISSCTIYMKMKISKPAKSPGVDNIYPQSVKVRYSHVTRRIKLYTYKVLSIT